jgi:hypothetical protein
MRYRPLRSAVSQVVDNVLSRLGQPDTVGKHARSVRRPRKMPLCARLKRVVAETLSWLESICTATMTPEASGKRTSDTPA